MKHLRTCLWALAAVTLTSVAGLAFPHLDGSIAGVVLVEGVSIEGATKSEASLAAAELAATWLDTPVTLIAGDRAVSATRRELGARVALSETEEQIAAHSLFDNPLAAIDAIDAFGAQEDLTLARSFDEAAGHAALERLRTLIDLPPVAASVGEDGHPTPPKSGRRLDTLAALEALETGLLSSGATIRLPVSEIAPPVSVPVAVEDATYTHVLSEFSTEYSLADRNWGRQRNIEISTAAIDGAVIPPFEEFSFNDLVGERTLERGFRYAKQVEGGRIVDGVGGGICQVAATLHAVSFTAGFDITEHHPHTRGSSYIDTGLDAAVTWPGLDLKIRNPYPFPVRIRASAEQGTAHVSLLGSAPATDVSWSVQVLRVMPRGRHVEVGPPGLPGADVVEPGADGMVVMRERVIGTGENARRELTELHYPPVDALVRVSP